MSKDYRSYRLNLLHNVIITSLSCKQHKVTDELTCPLKADSTLNSSAVLGLTIVGTMLSNFVLSSPGSSRI